MRTYEFKLLVKAAVRVAIYLAALAVEMFKVQFDYSRIGEVGRKVVSGVWCHPAHVNDRVFYFRWKTVNMLRIPGLVVRESARARKGARLSEHREQENARRR